ncbi:MAG: hypothetical protein ACE5IR_05250 [bacterium]
MINIKQQELIHQLYNQVKEKFPEIEFINVTRSPEDPDDLLVNITAPKNEDREIVLREYASELETDILMDYGYLIMLMPTRKNNTLRKADLLQEEPALSLSKG